MIAVLWGGLGSIMTFIVMAALGDMVSEEVRDRLDHLPHAILRLAAHQLDRAERAVMFDDEWLPELTYILKGDEARPVTRLVQGTSYAIGIFVAARRIARHLEHIPLVIEVRSARLWSSNSMVVRAGDRLVLQPGGAQYVVLRKLNRQLAIVERIDSGQRLAVRIWNLLRPPWRIIHRRGNAKQPGHHEPKRTRVSISATACLSASHGKIPRGSLVPFGSG
jgi:hypothetical protein